MKRGQITNGRIGIFYLIALFSFGAFMLLLLAARSATADDMDLPPRESPATPTEVLVQPNGQGARVHLQAHFSQDWPWEAMHWQEDLWVVVQWYDPSTGIWHDVDGWQGSFEAIQQAEDWMGMKELWLADVHLGTGPYRWQVFEKDSNHLLSTSEEFYLPARGGDLMAVDMMLQP